METLQEVPHSREKVSNGGKKRRGGTPLYPKKRFVKDCKREERSPRPLTGEREKIGLPKKTPALREDPPLPTGTHGVR